MALKRASRLEKKTCLDLIHGLQEFLPTGYAQAVVKALAEEGKTYNERQVYEVMQKRLFHIDIALALKKLAEAHKQSLDALIEG
jgi:hypothetical protein